MKIDVMMEQIEERDLFERQVANVDANAGKQSIVAGRIGAQRKAKEPVVSIQIVGCPENRNAPDTTVRVDENGACLRGFGRKVGIVSWNDT